MSKRCATHALSFWRPSAVALVAARCRVHALSLQSVAYARCRRSGKALSVLRPRAVVMVAERCLKWPSAVAVAVVAVVAMISQRN